MPISVVSPVLAPLVYWIHSVPENAVPIVLAGSEQKKFALVVAPGDRGMLTG
jgi:hypothetical protein